MAGDEASPPLRPTGIWPMPLKKVFLNFPFKPGWVK